MVYDKVVCVCEKWHVTKLCVCDKVVCDKGVCVCDKDGVWKLSVVTKVCVCDKVVCVWQMGRRFRRTRKRREERDTESKTRTLHKDVGEKACFVMLHYIESNRAHQMNKGEELMERPRKGRWSQLTLGTRLGPVATTTKHACWQVVSSFCNKKAYLLNIRYN